MNARPTPQPRSTRTQGTRALQQVLLALDATPHSEMVIESLHRFVKTDGISCDLAFVSPAIQERRGKFSALDEEFVNETERIVNQQFDQYTQTLAQQHITVNNRYFIRTPDSVEDGILSQIDNNTPDLLVLGMHHRVHGGRHIGSTSYDIATHAEGPVLVVKQPPRNAQTLKVLVATDGSSYAMNAAQQLTEFLPRENTEIHLLNVISVNVYTMPIVEPFVDYTPLEQALQGASKNILDHTAKIFSEAGYTVASQLFLLGDPVDQVLQEAQKQEIDLVVVGSHGTGDKLRKWLLGSVSGKILEYSPASVAILR